MSKSYSEAESLLKNKLTRKVAGNTYLEKYSDRDYIAVRFHWTEVVRYFPNGDVQLNSGGYRTATTKARMNEFSPATVYQKDFQWYVNGGEEFRDNMVISAA